MSKITAMYGRCDGRDIIFSQIGENLWTTKVPADLQDGMYVVEIYAQSANGYLAYYTGILYMCDSRCTGIEILKDDILVLIWTDQHQVLCVSDTVTVRLDDITVTLLSDPVKVEVVKQCQALS